MIPLPDPRPYWTGVPDDRLVEARDEYRAHGGADLLALADEIDDDLARRADFRRRMEAA